MRPNPQTHFLWWRITHWKIMWYLKKVEEPSSRSSEDQIPIPTFSIFFFQYNSNINKRTLLVRLSLNTTQKHHSSILQNLTMTKFLRQWQLIQHLLTPLKLPQPYFKLLCQQNRANDAVLSKRKIYKKQQNNQK